MFYVLTSHNIFALKRQFKTLNKANTTVIINTLDKDYEENAVNYCKSEGIRYVITESDGTAATGKNSFLDTFEQDGVPYAVLVDGDDYLTPRGVKVYTELALSGKAPDAVVLSNQIAVTFREDELHEMLNLPGRHLMDPTKFSARYVQPSTVMDWDELASGTLITENLPVYTPEELNCFRRYIRTLQYGMGINEIAGRIVFFSRKILPYRYRSLTVGEDTLQYLEVKDGFEKGLLSLVTSNENNPTYVYDCRLSGIAVEISQRDYGQGFLDWMVVLLYELEKMKASGRLHPTRLEVL